MKNFLLATLLSLSFAASSYATTYTDVNLDLYAFNSNHVSFTNEFNLLEKGYNPTSETIVSASACFLFTDILGGRESFTVDLGGNLFTQGSFFLVLALPQVASVDALFSLDQTGILSYTITRKSGDFQLGLSKLCAEATARNVPDTGATMLLVVLGLVGIVAAKRRFGSAS